MYILILFLSLASCWIGFYGEILQGNIRHLENGRAPNAGVAIMPVIPVVPGLYLLSAWFLVRKFDDIGFLIVIGYFVVASIVKYFYIRRLNAEFNRLKLTDSEH